MTESASSARRGGTARSRSRLRAVEILFEAEQRGTTPDEGIRARVDHTDLRVNAYAQQVIDGVIAEGAAWILDFGPSDLATRLTAPLVRGRWIQGTSGRSAPSGSSETSARIAS